MFSNLSSEQLGLFELVLAYLAGGATMFATTITYVIYHDVKRGRGLHNKKHVHTSHREDPLDTDTKYIEQALNIANS